MSVNKKPETVTFKADPSLFAAEEAKMQELKKSSSIEDQLTALLMEDHEPGDAVGLWYSFAKPKARAILDQFNVTNKETSSALPAGEV